MEFIPPSKIKEHLKDEGVASNLLMFVYWVILEIDYLFVVDARNKNKEKTESKTKVSNPKPVK